MGKDFFEELEKIANSSEVEDLNSDPMLEDPQPKMSDEEVEQTQAANSEPSAEAAEDQQPPSPDESDEINEIVDEAGEDLQEELQGKEAQEEDKDVDLEKWAEEIEASIYGMGALAALIKTANSEEFEDDIKKIATDRLNEAFESEEACQKILQKTADEIYSDEAEEEYIFTDEGKQDIVEHLALFTEDESFEKTAAPSGILNKVKKGAGDYVDSVRNWMKHKDDMKAANARFNQAQQASKNKSLAHDKAKQSGDKTLINRTEKDYMDHFSGEYKDSLSASVTAEENLQRSRVNGLIGAGVAGGSLYGGKKLYDSQKKEDQLSEKTASDTINQDHNALNQKGGNDKMSKELVRNFLKIAGASGLIEVANNEELDNEVRQGAADTFNKIAEMSQEKMGEEFEKVAQDLYSEDQLHEIVEGKHNDFMFDKVAFFTEAYEKSHDELYKEAGAGGVVAKGVGGALTDAKKQIETTIPAEKIKTEKINEGRKGSKPAGSKQGYNVINNPGSYKVEKTASANEDLDLLKEAAANMNELINQFTEKYATHEEEEATE